MAKFNVTDHRTAVHSPITTERTPTGRTHEGAPGYVREVKGELFLLAVSNMVGERAFYESGADRDDRYERLVAAATTADPEWTAGFLRWLRSEGNMRSASLVGAATFARARLDAGEAGMSRQVIDSVLQRADEPGEMLAYWTSRYGRAVPKPVKRGIADAALRLYAEYPLLKYDTGTRAVRFADVLELTHPGDRKGSSQSHRFQGLWQYDLFKHSIDRRHNRDGATPATLHMVRANERLRELAEDDPESLLDTGRLREAGMTWEDVLSLVGSKVDKAKLWEALAPVMGYMATIRNLRNFDEAGMSDAVAEQVAARIADPEQVARSRQFPYRFLSAHLAAPSQRWGHALDKALTASTQNIPAFPGRTLVLVDTSASMTQVGFSARSQVTPAWAAALFGVALASRNPGAVDLYGFADGQFAHPVQRGGSVLRECERFIARTGEVGHGTQIVFAVAATYHGHDRVVIISDMQTMSGGYGRGVSEQAPAHVPMYGFNLQGYQHGAMPSGLGTRHELGGLTDATFRMIPLLEAGRDARWPWED